MCPASTRPMAGTWALPKTLSMYRCRNSGPGGGRDRAGAPGGQQSQEQDSCPAAFSWPSSSSSPHPSMRDQVLCSPNQHSLLLNCTFTFTQTISELEQGWEWVRGGTGAPQKLGAPGPESPGQGRAGEGALGRQSPGTSSPRARAQQASSSSHINTDTLNKNSISFSQGIKTSLEYVQQRARGGQCCAGGPRGETGCGWNRGEKEA